MDSPLPPTESRSVLDREAVARIIDPAAWGVLDGTIPQLPMTAKDRDRFDAWKQSSLRKADAILALALSLYAKIVEERDEAREAMKWVGQVYPSAREGGAWVSMAWTEFNRMRRFVGLTELPRRAAKGERQSVNIRLREALAAAEARSEKAERERDEARGGWPEGWVLVPREPTEEMLDAGDAPFHNEWKRQREYAAKYGKPEGFGSAPFSEAIYRAMIAEAALSPPLVGGGSSAVSQSGSALRGAPSDAEGH